MADFSLLYGYSRPQPYMPFASRPCITSAKTESNPSHRPEVSNTFNIEKEESAHPSAQTRLDLIVAEKCDCSRTYAQELIESGLVSRDGKVLLKPGMACEAAGIVVGWKEKKYVSRGGYKLEKALDFFRVGVSGLVCADIGASTGGFTDCLLQNGAKIVYAVENGSGQLHESLRDDPKVISLENTDIRAVDPADFPQFDLVTVDVSFISLTKILPHVKNLLKPGGIALCLVKPQFEAGKSAVGKGGVVRDAKVRRRAVETAIEFARAMGMEILGETESPITGGDGNVEYWVGTKNT